MTTLLTGTLPPGTPAPPAWTAADLVARFGPILLSRIRFDPPPGSATEDDVVAIREREKRLCELVDGTLVEKTVGLQEAFLAVLIARLIGNFAEAGGLGIVLGADGMARLAPGLIRIPDVSFIPWSRYPDHRVPRLPFVLFAPDLAVEVLSPSNTKQEMDRKLRDYFEAGVRLVWYVDPATRTVRVFQGPDDSTLLAEADTLDGGAVLPGFAVPLKQLFAGLKAAPRA